MDTSTEFFALDRNQGAESLEGFNLAGVGSDLSTYSDGCKEIDSQGRLRTDAQVPRGGKSKLEVNPPVGVEKKKDTSI